MPEPPKGWKQLQWTPEDIKGFRAALKQALDDKKEEFTFQGNPFHTGYAHYLNQHLIHKGL